MTRRYGIGIKLEVIEGLHPGIGFEIDFLMWPWPWPTVAFWIVPYFLCIGLLSESEGS